MYYDGAYAPFGEPYAQSGSTDLNFTGMNQDTAANVYDFPEREYGIQGRWPSPDPAGLAAVNPMDPQTWNRYAYVRNSPLELVDPTGMLPDGPHCAGVSGLRMPRAESCGGGCDDWGFGCMFGGGGSGGGTEGDEGAGGGRSYTTVYADFPTPFGSCWEIATDFEGFSDPAWAVPCIYDSGAQGSIPIMIGRGRAIGAVSLQQPPQSITKRLCIEDAYDKANTTAINMVQNNMLLPFKTAGVGAVDGFIVGCVITAEGGCVEGGVPAALTGAMGGLLLGGAKSIYNQFVDYFRVINQLNNNLAACDQQGD